MSRARGSQKISPAPNDPVAQLRLQALEAHQTSIGRGDQLVKILERTIRQLERAGSRIQWMSMTVFVAGLVLLGVGVYENLVGKPDLWATIMGGGGGLAAFLTTFWTAPVERISATTNDLVKLETAFLGYIRVVGEIDSAFQMEYLRLLAEDAKNTTSLTALMLDTTTQVKNATTATMELIDKYVGGDSDAMSVLSAKQTDIEERLTSLENSSASPSV